MTKKTSATLSETFEDAPPDNAAPTLTQITPGTAAAFIPGLKVDSTLNGKTKGKWKLRDHTGKIVHSSSTVDEIIRLYKVHAVNALPSEENNYDGRGWDILPHDPRKESDSAVTAKNNAIAALRAKRALTVESSSELSEDTSEE